jgi:F-type H+-transporting ATPase subunit gamma
VPSIRQLRRRIRGVQNTRQITRAMELVASSRLRRAQELVLASRPYAERIRLVINNLAAVSGAQELHPLLQVRPVSRAAVILYYQPWPVRQSKFQHGSSCGSLCSRSRRVR